VFKNAAELLESGALTTRVGSLVCFV
jgi:hypothetical protein